MDAHWWLVEKWDKESKLVGDEDFVDYVDDINTLKRKVKDNTSEYGDDSYDY